MSAHCQLTLYTRHARSSALRRPKGAGSATHHREKVSASSEVPGHRALPADGQVGERTGGRTDRPECTHALSFRIEPCVKKEPRGRRTTPGYGRASGGARPWPRADGVGRSGPRPPSRHAAVPPGSRPTWLPCQCQPVEAKRSAKIIQTAANSEKVASRISCISLAEHSFVCPRRAGCLWPTREAPCGRPSLARTRLRQDAGSTRTRGSDRDRYWVCDSSSFCFIILRLCHSFVQKRADSTTCSPNSKFNYLLLLLLIQPPHQAMQKHWNVFFPLLYFVGAAWRQPLSLHPQPSSSLYDGPEKPEAKGSSRVTAAGRRRHTGKETPVP